MGSFKKIVSFVWVIAGFNALLLHAADNLNALPVYDEEYKTATQMPAVSIHIAGATQLVLSADAPHCNDVDSDGRRMDVPDTPLRAVRTDRGLLVVATNYNNLAYTSDDLSKLKRRDCKSMLPSGLDGDPSHFSNHEWLISPYVIGNNIYSLVHDEYWGGLYNHECRARLGNRVPWDSVCLYVNMTSAVSDDGWEFHRTGIAAAYPYAFATDMNRAGIRDPSNVFRNPKDGYIYFMAWADPYKNQTGGECLFRSKNPLTDPWLAWNGTEFSVHMESPYVLKSAPVFCSPVSGLWISTIVYDEPHRVFIALSFDERVKPGGIFYRTSLDLIHWSKPALLLEAHNGRFWKPDNTMAPIVYPSLLDPTSTSVNFDTIGIHPYLYFFQWRVKDGQLQGRERDIMRIPLAIRSSQ